MAGYDLGISWHDSEQFVDTRNHSCNRTPGRNIASRNLRHKDVTRHNHVGLVKENNNVAIGVSVGQVNQRTLFAIENI